MKDLEKEKQTEELAKVKQTRADVLANRAKTVEEKKHELYKAVD